MTPHKKTGLPNEQAPIVSQSAQDDQSGKSATLQDNASSTQRVGPDGAAPSTVAVQTKKPVKAPNQNRSSWYTGGSWRSKASPVAEVARESISVDKGISSESSSQDDGKPRPGQSVSKGLKGSRKSIPLIAEATRVHATSDAADKSKLAKAKFPGDEKPKNFEAPVIEETKPPVTSEATEPKELPSSPEAAALDNERDADPKSEEMSEVRPQSWLSWWSRPDGYASDGERIKRDSKADADAPHAKSAEAAPEEHNNIPAVTPAASTQDTESRFRSEMNGNAASARSWFGLWSSVQNQQATAEESGQADPEQKPASGNAADAKTATTSTNQPAKVTQQSKSDENKPKLAEERSKASGWAFWSSEKTGEAIQDSGETQKQVGQLAVADTPSQSHPEAAQYNEQRKETKAEGSAGPKRTSSLLRLKRGRPNTTDEPSNETQSGAVAIERSPQNLVELPEPSPAPVPGGKRPLQTRPNLILPSIRETYPMAPSLSTLERLTQYVAQSLHLPGSVSAPPPKHPYLTSSPPKIRKAIAIGVHGFFPTPLIQRVIGQPTGTSIRFANSAAGSIKQWCQDHQPDVKNVEIEKVALEGEGYIADRVATLWKLLLNWLSHLRQADFILVACHSQGVPVAIMLVAKLIQLGCLSQNARIGICAMAGINLGPFVEYKSRLFGGIALELFDFCESKSKVSVAYLDSLDVCLRNGVRVTFVGSLDDQLVSLESSLHVPLTHPYVNRAVFVDGRLHSPNFLTHLVAFAIKLRNLGANDHGLVREVSAALAGNLVSGEGHSRLYDDPAVYSMAVEFALESTNMEPPPKSATAPLSAAEEERAREAETQRRGSLSGYPNTTAAANSMRRGSLTSLSLGLPGIAPIVASYEAPGVAGSGEKNPYVLPWAVRGMLAEDCVKKDPKMQEEVKELVKEFEDWKPTSKVLRDVRWRLEGVRSML